MSWKPNWEQTQGHLSEWRARSAYAQLARGCYLTALPDLVENIDILSARRDPQTLMVEMIENPEWVRGVRRVAADGCASGGPDEKHDPATGDWTESDRQRGAWG